MSDWLTDTGQANIDALITDEEEHFLEELEPYQDYTAMAEALRGSLSEEHADAPPEVMQEALFDVLESMSPAESISVGQALQQIGRASGLEDPTFRRIAAAAVPVAAPLIGTAVVGPAGGVVGGALGQVVAKALEPAAKAAPTAAPPKPPPAPAAPAGGSAAGSDPAAKALVLTQNRWLLERLLALAMGERGSQPAGALPGPHMSLLSTLSTLLAKAAEDADELWSTRDEFRHYPSDGEAELLADPVDPLDRAETVYSAVIEAENNAIAHQMGWE